MSFVIPPADEPLAALRKHPPVRSLAARLAFIFLPSGIALCLLFGWLGFQVASSTLGEALPTIPLLEAKFQAEKIEKTLTILRDGIFQIAQETDINPQKLRNALRDYFHDYAPLIAEFAYQNPAGDSFLLLHDGAGNFIALDPALASSGTYAPFPHIATISRTPGEVVLYPAVRVSYPVIAETGQALQPGQTNQATRLTVIRMALSLGAGRGALILGLDLTRLCARLAVYLQADSPLRTPMQEGVSQLAYYFEPNGWIIFEIGSETGSSGEFPSFFPDAARRGYEGDLGRPGFDAAFRPWAAHENYWRMVLDITAGHSGFLKKYAIPESNGAAVCYAPIAFAPNPELPPRSVAGLAFQESSYLPITAFYRAANATVISGICVLVVLSLLVFSAGRKLALPLRRVVEQLRDMMHTGRLVPLVGLPTCEEQQILLEAGNELIARNLAMQADVERMLHELRQSRSVLPVDMDGVAAYGEYDNFGLIGSSLLMQKVREEVHKAGQAGADVLIRGETGTGKELVAAAIHRAGISTNGLFVSINCGALDENLLLDALFGHVKGAFTEAKSDRKGAFLSAEGGTLFLDEIANASLKVQQALLRALAVRRIRPLGTDEEIPFATRVVASTNVDLLEATGKGLFREDLYYRLAIINIITPPLRRRKEDIPELAAFFIC